jgi:hypothetical protein
MNAVASRMTDNTIAQFVSRNVIDSLSSTDRIAEVFQTLVKVRIEGGCWPAREDVAESPLGSTGRLRRRPGSGGGKDAHLLY